MNRDQIRALIVETVVRPASAAKDVLAVQVPRNALWTALALVGVMNGLYYGLLLPSAAAAGMVPVSMANAPLIVTGAVLTILVVMVFLLTISGRVLGGQGDLDALLKITVWLQGLRLLAQVAISIVSLAIPAIGWLAAMVIGIWGIWILVVFIAAAHGFATSKGFGTLLGTFVATVFALSILSAILGLGVPAGDL